MEVSRYMKEKVTVVIPNYNGQDYIETCLNSVRNQTYENYKVLIIDNNSQDGSCDIIRDKFKEFELVVNDKNEGFCKAVNQGIKMSDTEFVLLLNNDTELDRYFLENIVQEMEKSDKIFSVSSKMINYYDREIMDDAGDGYTIIGWQYQRGIGQSVNDYNSRAEVFTACGGAALYRMSVFDEIGLFDEMHFAYMEDIDIGYRARIYGYKNFYCPKAKVYHIGSATTGSKYNDFKVRMAARNNLYVIYKNMPIVQFIINCPFITVGMVVKYLFFRNMNYGESYLKGIKEGISNLYKLKQVKYDRANLDNYINIELNLIKCTFEYVRDYIKRHK
jgi:GT2 family glycosyltransferase